jgi:hypothetical protein
VVVAVKAYVNLYRSGFGYHGHGYEDRQVAENQAEPDAVAVAYEVEIPDPPAAADPADMLVLLADMARDPFLDFENRERVEWALAEIERLKGIINRRDYFLKYIGRTAADICASVDNGLEDPS